jgi:Xaa-Pro aminopeptidase
VHASPPAAVASPTGIPFDHDQLDRLLEEASLDAVVVTSPHNVRYMLGGYYFFMYEIADSIGLSRYVPAVAYRRGSPDDSCYVGAGNEDWATENEPLWVPDVRSVAWGAAQAAEEVLRWCSSRLPAAARIGVELPYLPTESHTVLATGGFELCDVTTVLETLRAVKRPHELELVRRGSTAVVDAMLATFETTHVGDSKVDVYERLRVAETQLGLQFCYALLAAGANFNRGPSSQRLQAGDVLSLDSGASFHGWVADLTRMAILGEPTPRHEELLAQVDHVQQAARARARADVRGGDLFDAAHAAIVECDDRKHMSFLAHGTGLVTHEAPRLTATGSPPYAASHAELPLRSGMVLSVESQIADPQLGFIKLEDTVIVGEDGPEAVGDHKRGWNLTGR